MSLKPKPIQISIPSPCHEDWQQMRPGGQGRFCGHCQKSVIDFTGWSNEALFNFFNKNTEGVCGRFLVSQVNRPIHIPYQPHSRLYRLVIAAGLVLLFAQPAAAQTQQRAPLISQSVHISIEVKTDTLLPAGMGGIKGQVLDNNNEPVIDAMIQIMNGKKVMGGALTDTSGYYEIWPVAEGEYELKITTDYKENQALYHKELIIVHDQKITLYNVQLEASSYLLSGELSGEILDDKREPIANAIIEVYENGKKKTSTITDNDGNYIVKDIGSGHYNVEVKYEKYRTVIMNNVIVSPDKTTGLNFNLQPNLSNNNEPIIKDYNPPVIIGYFPGPVR